MKDFKFSKYLFISILCLIMTITAVGLPGVSSAGDKLVKLKVVTHMTPAYGDSFDPYVGMVDYINLYGKSRGLSAELFHSQTIYKAKEFLPALISGSVDIVIFMAPYIEGTIPIFGVSDLPFIWGDVYTQREGSRKGSPYYNLVAKECSKRGLQLLAMPSDSCQEVISTKPLRKLEDFKGLKIRVAGAANAKAFQAIGAVPISMPSGEVYTSLQRGVVDAALAVDITFSARKLYEVAKYQTNMSAFQFDFPVIMNKGRFDSLSEEQKKVVWNAAEHFRHDFSVCEIFGGCRQLRNILAQDHGVEQIYLSESERARMKKAMWGPTVKWWKKRVGPELADKALKAVEESKHWRKSNYGHLELYPLKY